MARGVKGSGPKPAPAVKSAPADIAMVSPLAPLNAAPLGSLDIDSLEGEALRTYALRAGVMPRDVQHLTEDRLRQNTKLVIANHFALLTED